MGRASRSAPSGPWGRAAIPETIVVSWEVTSAGFAGELEAVEPTDTRHRKWHTRPRRTSPSPSRLPLLVRTATIGSAFARSVMRWSS